MVLYFGCSLVFYNLDGFKFKYSRVSTPVPLRPNWGTYTGVLHTVKIEVQQNLPLAHGFERSEKE